MFQFTLAIICWSEVSYYHLVIAVGQWGSLGVTVEWMCCTWSLSRVRLFATSWTVAHQAPLSMRILQARILELGALSFYSGSSRPKDWTRISCISRWILYQCIPGNQARIKRGTHKNENCNNHSNIYHFTLYLKSGGKGIATNDKSPKEIYVNSMEV